MALRVSESKFWDNFSIQTSPQNPHKNTLGTQIGPQKVILRFLNIFSSFSLEHGPFFSTLNPTTLNSFLDFQTFSRSFICINTVKKISSVTFLAFWRLGPRPTVQSAVVLVRFDILPKEQLWSGHTWQTYHLVLICLWSPISSIIQCSMVSNGYCSFPNKNW